MSNYMTKAAAHARLIKLARAAHYIRRQRALQKYAQAVQMQKYALSDAAAAGFGAGAGGLLGGGLGYVLGGKDKKLLSTLIGAGAGAGIGGLGGYGIGKYMNRPQMLGGGTAFPNYIEGNGVRIDEIPEEVEDWWEDLENPEDFGLKGKGWRIATNPSMGRYISNGNVTYYASPDAVKAQANARRTDLGMPALK